MQLRFFARRHLLALSAVFFLIAVAAHPSWAVRLNDRAPDFTLSDRYGKAVSLGSLQGKVVYVNFWASWCGPCKQEFPELARLAERYRDSGLVVLAVNQDKQRSHMDRFLESHDPLPVNFVVLPDPDSRVIGSFGPRSMPTSFIIDREGIIRYIHFGFSEKDPATWPGEIEALLQ